MPLRRLEKSMNVIEYKVRPVTRFVVTRYESNPETGSGAVETIGEYPNEWYAQRVKTALEAADPGGDELPLQPAPR